MGIHLYFHGYSRSSSLAYTSKHQERTRKVQIAPLVLRETRAVADSAVLNLTACVVMTVSPAVPISSSVIYHVGVVSRYICLVNLMLVYR